MIVAYQNTLPAWLCKTHEELENLLTADIYSFDKVEEADFAEMYNGVIYLDPAKLKEAQSTCLRTERDRRLAATDFLLMPDYPVSEADRERVKAYRTALRDLPAAEGFPWSGKNDDPAVPWPPFPDLKNTPEQPEVPAAESAAIPAE